jgi:hypothetical protein
MTGAWVDGALRLVHGLIVHLVTGAHIDGAFTDLVHLGAALVDSAFSDCMFRLLWVVHLVTGARVDCAFSD